MGDYGIKTFNKGQKSISSDPLDVLMTSRYPFTKIDQTNDESFRTTNINFVNNIPINTKILLHSFKHGYDYEPQVWGLWDITFGPGTTTPNQNRNGYGSVSNSTGIPSIEFHYEYNDEDVNIYVELFDPMLSGMVSIIGTTASLTTYIFADDLTNQDYS